MTWLLRRLAIAVPLLLGVVTVNFLLIQLAPGDPVTALVGEYPAPEAYVTQLRADFGLDQPVWNQYLAYLGQLLHGNLGYSFANRQPVTDVIGQYVWPTALLGLTAIAIAAAVGTGLGMWAARHRGRTPDKVTQQLTILGYSLPDFWVGQVAIVVFVVALGWFPFQGMRTFGSEARGAADALDVAHHLVLPALVLSLRYTASIARITRASMVSALSEDFIRAVRAKGASERTVRIRHALRNAAPPIVTTIGFDLGFLFAGAVLVEIVFGWPGLGRLLDDSLGRRDYPVMLGVLLLISLTVVVVNIITDLVVTRLDPRARA